MNCMKQVWKNVFMLCFARRIDFEELNSTFYQKTGHTISNLLDDRNSSDIALFDLLARVLKVKTYQLFCDDASMIKTYLRAVLNVIVDARIKEYQFAQNFSKLVIEIDETKRMVLGYFSFIFYYGKAEFRVDVPQKYLGKYRSYRGAVEKYLHGNRYPLNLRSYEYMPVVIEKQCFVEEIPEERLDFENLVFYVFLEHNLLSTESELKAMSLLRIVSEQEEVSYYLINRICRLLDLKKEEFFAIIRKNNREYIPKLGEKLRNIFLSKEYNWISLDDKLLVLRYREYQISIENYNYFQWVNIEINGMKASCLWWAGNPEVTLIYAQAAEYRALKEKIEEKKNDQSTTEIKGTSTSIPPMVGGPSVCSTSQALLSKLCYADYTGRNKDELVYGYINAGYSGYEDVIYNGIKSIYYIENNTDIKHRMFLDNVESDIFVEEIMKYGRVLKKMELNRIAEFDWTSIELILHDERFFEREESNSLRELVCLLKETESLELAINNRIRIYDEIKMLIGQAYANRKERLNELIKHIYEKKSSFSKVIRIKYELLCELYSKVMKENSEYIIDEPEIKLESDCTILFKELVYLYIPQLRGKAIDCVEAYRRLKHEPEYIRFDYYFDFSSYLYEEADEDIRCLIDINKDEWDKAVVLEDNPTYLKYPELKVCVSKSFEKIISTEVALLTIYWQEKYDNFVLYCSQREWYSMRDLLKCDFRELYYNGGSMNISKQQVNAIILEYIEWINGLNKKVISDKPKQEESVNTVLDMFWL